MSNDATPIQLTKLGQVAITEFGIAVAGFEGENTMCRDVSVLACLWAIGELQREVSRAIERPGGGEITICDLDDTVTGLNTLRRIRERSTQK